MEASLITRSFIKPANCHLINTILLSKHQSPLLISKHTTFSNVSLFNPPSFQSIYTTPVSLNHVASIVSGQNDTSFVWKFASNGENKKPVVTVVVLGWLGSKQAHLRRYAEMYSMLGVNVVTCAVSVEGIIGFDLGRTLESRVVALCDEIVEWVEGKEDDGRERLLMFHTFSNTGWLGYGYILNILQGRDELREKIIGCVVDSGGDPELNPKVWATGFTKAILTKKESSAVNISEVREVRNGNIEEKRPSFTEILLMTLFKTFFTLFILIPDIKTRVIKVTTTLSQNQPNHPQLYLYSTIDEVIPFQKIESFVEHQKKLGRKVTTFNFKSSSHLDHYRTFPYIYRSLIQDFMKECLAAKGKELDNGFVAGQTALKAESSKVAKHEKACLENQHVFIPFAFDTFGFLAPEAGEFLTRVQWVVQSNFSTPKTQNFIFNRIGFAIQKGVAAQLVARLSAILL